MHYKQQHFALFFRTEFLVRQCRPSVLGRDHVIGLPVQLLLPGAEFVQIFASLLDRWRYLNLQL